MLPQRTACPIQSAFCPVVKKPAARRPVRQGVPWRRAVLAAGVLLAAGSVSLTVWHFAAERQKHALVEREKSENRLREMVAGYQNRRQELTRKTQEKITSIYASANSQAAACGFAAAQPLRGAGNVVGCISDGALDKLSGSKRLDHRITGALQPVVKFLSDTQRESGDQLKAHRHALLGLINEFQTRTLEMKDSGNLTGPNPHDPTFAAIEQTARKACSQSQMAAISVAGECAFIQSTFNTVSRPLIPLIARQCGALSLGGGAALVDGPLPFGDILGALLAVGTTAWTAWDVSEVVKTFDELPGNITHNLTTELAGLQSASLEDLAKTDAACSAYFSSLSSKIP